MSIENNHINYIEFKSSNIEETKKFYSRLFDWKFTDYGPNYVSFSGAGIDGGFEFTEENIVNGVLIVLYHSDLETILQKVTESKAKITQPIFSFPGGRRFQFLDTSGNELAIWSE